MHDAEDLLCAVTRLQELAQVRELGNLPGVAFGAADRGDQSLVARDELRRAVGDLDSSSSWFARSR